MSTLDIQYHGDDCEYSTFLLTLWQATFYKTDMYDSFMCDNFSLMDWEATDIFLRYDTVIGKWISCVLFFLYNNNKLGMGLKREHIGYIKTYF